MCIDTGDGYKIKASLIEDIVKDDYDSFTFKCDRFECDSVSSVTFYSVCPDIQSVYWNGVLCDVHKIRGSKVNDYRYRIENIPSMKSHNIVVISASDKVFVSSTIEGYEPTFNQSFVEDFDKAVMSTDTNYVKLAYGVPSIESLKIQIDCYVKEITSDESITSFTDFRKESADDQTVSIPEVKIVDDIVYIAKSVISNLINSMIAMGEFDKSVLINLNGFEYQITDIQKIAMRCTNIGRNDETYVILDDCISKDGVTMVVNDGCDEKVFYLNTILSSSGNFNYPDITVLTKTDFCVACVFDKKYAYLINETDIKKQPE